MTFSKKAIFIALIGLVTACSPQNTTLATVEQKCCDHKENCCKDGCDKCQKCKETNCECVKCASKHQSATDFLLNNQQTPIKCENHK